MTQQQKDKLNKQLCGLLGINPKILSVMGGMMWEYPDFTSEAGRVQLLRLMWQADESKPDCLPPKIGFWWDKLSSPYLIVEYMLNDNGSFAIAARGFLKAMEGK